MFDDVTSVALQSALDGLATRQRVIADNISNINTPGFLAGKVAFEDALRSAIAAGAPGTAESSTRRSLEPTREDGNNVNLDRETLDNVETGLRYQLALRAMDQQYGVMRSAMRTS